MHLVLCCTDIGSDHLVHHRVEVANPRELKRFIRATTILDIILKDIGHNGALDTLTLVFGGYTEDDTKHSVARLTHLQFVHKTQLINKSELTVKFTYYAVKVGHHNKETNRFVVVIGKIYQIRVNNRAERTHKSLRLLLCHLLNSRKERPRLVVDGAQIFSRLFEVCVAYIFDLILRICQYTMCLFECNLAQHAILRTPYIGILVKEVLETIVLKKSFVIWRMIRICVERLVVVTLNKKTPPRITRAEVYRSVHSLHTLRGEPIAGSVKHHICHLLIVDTLKETATTCRLLIVIRAILVIECRDTTHSLARLAILNIPTDSLAVLELLILLRIEYCQNIVIQRADPILIVLIYRTIYVQPHLLILSALYLFKNVTCHSFLLFILSLLILNLKALQ